MGCPSDSSIQALLAGEVAPEELENLAAHLDGCGECRLLVGAVAPGMATAGLPPARSAGARSGDEDDEGDRIGRYVLRRPLGEGGMGTVYEAYDPALDRVVAIKRLRGSRNGPASLRRVNLEKRLQVEALAMAKLSHPNVVPVHDVGESDRGAFIVMGLVKGASLRTWLIAKSRAAEEVLTAFLHAGEGLQAAHEAGLCHRDFKPDNVLMDSEGRAVVSDFGLATLGELAEVAVREGTRKYMPPEQLNGSFVDARSDQYAFGVSLREAFDLAAEIATESEAPPVVKPPWLEEILERATHTTPALRYPSMRDLLSDIRAHMQKQPVKKRGGALLSVALLLVATGVTGFVFARNAKQATAVNPCAEVAALEEAWNEPAAGRIEAAFRSTQVPFWDFSFAKLRSRLNAETARMKDSGKRICADAKSNSGTSFELDRRRACLITSTAKVAAIARVLERVEARNVERAPDVVGLLNGADACADPSSWPSRTSPLTAEARVLESEVQRKFSEASALFALGNFVEGLDIARPARTDAAKLGAAREAEGELLIGIGSLALGEAATCKEKLERAANMAEKASEHLLSAQAWASLAECVGTRGGNAREALSYLDKARVELDRVPPSIELDAKLRGLRRTLTLSDRRVAEARAVSDEELKFVGPAFGTNHPRYAEALGGRARVLRATCLGREATHTQEELCPIIERNAGPDHPQFASCLSALAEIYSEGGADETALATAKRAIAIFARLQTHSDEVAEARRVTIHSMQNLGMLTDASKELEFAEAQPGSKDSIALKLARSGIALRGGRIEEAQRGVTVLLQGVASMPAIDRVDTWMLASDVMTTRSEFRGAASAAKSALQSAESAHGAKSCHLAYPLVRVAETLLEVHEASEANAALKRARSQLDLAEQTPLLVARLEFAEARAAPRTELSRALALARAAYTRLGTAPRERARATTILAWMNAHGTPAPAATLPAAPTTSASAPRPGPTADNPFDGRH